MANIFASPYTSLANVGVASGKELAKQNKGITGNRWIDNIFGGAVSSFARGLGDTAQFIGANNVGDLLNSGADSIEEHLRPAIPASFSGDYFSPEGIGRGLGNLGGSIASIVAPTLLVPGSGLVGAGGRVLTGLPNLFRIGSKVLRAPSALARMYGYRVPNIGMGTAKEMVRGAFTAPMEASMEAGSTERSLLEQGVDPETARQRAWGVFGNNVGLLTASNALQFGLFNKILNGTGLKSRGISALANAGIQGGEEYAQQGFQNIAEGKPFSENAGQAALEGFLPMLATGAIGLPLGSVRNYLRDKNKTNNPQPSEDTPTIQTSPSSGSDYIDWINGQGIKGRDKTANKVIAAAQKYGVDPKLALSVGIAESGFNQNDISDAGAIGVMQLMPATARELGVDPYNEDQNIDGGMRFLKQMLDRYNGNWQLATAAYNAGPGNVTDHVPVNGETEHYVERISNLMQIPMAHTANKNQTQQTQQQGNSLKIMPQTGKNCTREAMAAIYNAYTGENTTVNDWAFGGEKGWATNLENGKLKAKVYDFGQNEKTQFEQTIKDHFDQKPNNPIFLYQAGGDGSAGNHKLNRVSGTHATIIGRKLDNGKYQVFDSNGGITHELALDEIFDSSAHGGSGIRSNALWIPTIDPVKNITQWQNSTSSSSQTSRKNSTTTQDDPNFSEIQNKMWRMAQRAADRANARGYNLKPEWIYGQWAHEAIPTFDSDLAKRDHNYGGLKDTKGNWRHYNSPEEFADSYVDDFIANDSGDLRPELKKAKTVEDFVRIMGETGYFDPVSDNGAAYLEAVRKYGANHPNTQGYSEGEEVSDSAEIAETDSEQAQVERDTSNDEFIRSLLEPTPTPNFNLDDDNAINQDFFKNFVDDKLKNGTAEEIAQLGAILQNFYNENGEFQNTKENRQALANALGEDNLKNLGQQNLNSKIADYKNFLQTRINPLQEEISKLEEKHRTAQADYDSARTYQGLQGSGHGRILKGLRQSVIDTKNDWDKKLADLSGIQKILNPEPVETKPVEKFTATLNQNAKSKPTDKNLLSMLELDETPTFNPTSKNAVTRNIIEDFIKQKISDTQDKSLRKFLNADNKLISNQGTRQKISNQFGEELQTFGQSELDKRLEELKSRYKIERPAPRESVDVLPEKEKSEDEVLEQAKALARQALVNNDEKNYFGLLDAIGNQDISAVRQLIENAKSQKAKNSAENIQNLRAEINALNKWRAAEQKKLNQAIKSRNQSAYDESDKIVKRLDGRISDLKSTPEYLAEVQNELETWKSRRENATDSQQTGLIDKNISDLENEINSIEKPAETSTEEETAPKETVDLLAEIDDLKKEFNRLDKELDKATKKRDNKKVEELKKQIDEVEEKFQAKQAELEEHKKTPQYLEDLKNDLKDNEEHLEKLKHQNKQFGATSARNKHIKETEETISRLKNEIADIEKPAENQEVEVTAELEKATFKSKNTGKNLPIAQLKNKIPDAEFQELLALAKQHGGNYQRLAKGFIFKTADERDAFISEVNDETSQEEIETAQENTSVESQQVEETPRGYFKQLQKEISDLWKQRKAEQKRQIKAAQSRDKETFADSTNKLDSLKKKIDSLTEEQRDFKNSPLYQQMLQDEIDDLQNFKQGLEGNKDSESLKELDKINKEILAKENDLNYYKNLSQADEITENKKAPRKENVSRETYQNAGIAGNSATVETDSGKQIKIQYKIVPATSLSTSHKLEGDDVFENKDYPAKLQPRDRTGELEKAQVIKMRNNLRTAFLGENARVNEGAPVVRDDGTVLNGNGRTMAIEGAYNEGKADNYKQFLIDNAEKFGFNADDIEKIENPVLVREVTQELDDKTTSEITGSKVGGMSFKVSEQALTDAEILTLKDFDNYKENVDGDISIPSNDDFCRNVLIKIAPSENERNKYYDNKGNLNADAISRINNAIYALAYKDYNLISKNAESTNDNIKNISSAAQKAAVDFARLKLKQKENLAEKYDIGEVVADAIKLYDQVKDDKKFNSVSDYVAQERQNLFEPRQQAILDMLQVFDNYKRNSETLKDYLKDIAKAADKKPNPNQSQLFEDDYQTAQIDELVRNVTSKYLQDIPSGNMSDLFAEEERKAGEQKAREKMLAENEKTESQKIYERGEQRAREKFQQENSEVAEVEENNLVEENQEQQTETSQQEKSETQSQEEFKSRQEEMHENKPSIYREGNKFVVNVGEDVSNAKLMLFGTLLKKYNGKYRRGTKTFEFSKASAAMSFATNVEITKFDNDERQKMYRKARVADFPILKQIFDAGFNNPQAVDTLKYLQSLPTKDLARISTEALLNNYKGDDAKFKNAQKLFDKMVEGKIQTTPTDAYNKVFDTLFGEETENGETLPALNPPQTLLNFGDENTEINRKSVQNSQKPAENDKIQQSSQRNSQPSENGDRETVKSKRKAVSTLSIAYDKPFTPYYKKLVWDFLKTPRENKEIEKFLQSHGHKVKSIHQSEFGDIHIELVGHSFFSHEITETNFDPDAIKYTLEKSKKHLYNHFKANKYPAIKKNLDNLFNSAPTPKMTDEVEDAERAILKELDSRIQKEFNGDIEKFADSLENQQNDYEETQTKKNNTGEQEIEKPAGLKNQAVNDSPAGSESSTLKTRQDSTTEAEELSPKEMQMFNAQSPEQNVQNDSLSPSAETIPQTQEQGKGYSDFTTGEFLDMQDKKYFAAFITGDRFLEEVDSEDLKKLAEKHNGIFSQNRSYEDIKSKGVARFETAKDRDAFLQDAELEKILDKEMYRQLRKRGERQLAEYEEKERQAKIQREENKKREDYASLVEKGLGEEDLSREEWQKIIDNRNLLTVDENLRESLYKKFPEIKHYIDRLFRAEEKKLRPYYGYEDARKSLASIVAVNKKENDMDRIYRYAAQGLYGFWSSENNTHGYSRQAESNKDKSEKARALLDDDKLSAQELYAKMLKLLHNKVEKPVGKSTETKKTQSEENSKENSSDETVKKQAESSQEQETSAVYSYVNALHKDDANITLSEVKKKLEDLIGADNVEKFNDKIEKLHKEIHNANAKLGRLKSQKKDNSNTESSKVEPELRQAFGNTEQNLFADTENELAENNNSTVKVTEKISEDALVTSETESSNEANVSPTVNASSTETIPQSEEGNKSKFKSDEEVRDELKNNPLGVFERIDQNARDILKNLGIKISKPLTRMNGKVEPHSYYYLSENEREPKSPAGWYLVISTAGKSLKLGGHSHPNFDLYNPTKDPKISENIEKIIEKFNGKSAYENARFLWYFDTFEEGETFARALNLFFGNYEYSPKEYDSKYGEGEFERYINRKFVSNKQLADSLKKLGAEIENEKIIYPSKEIKDKIERAVAFTSDITEIKENTDFSKNTILDRALEKKQKVDTKSAEESGKEQAERNETDQQIQKVFSQFKRKIITEDETISHIAKILAKSGEENSRQKAQDIFYKEFPKPKTVAECKDFSELKRLWQENYNVKVDNEIKNLDFDAVKQALKGLETLFEKFPFLAKDLTLIGVDKGRSSRVLMSVWRGNRFQPTSLTLSKHLFSAEGAKKANEIYANGLKNKTNLTVADKTGKADFFEITGSHEAGHLVENFLCKKLGVIKGIDGISNLISQRFVNFAVSSIDKAEKQGKTLRDLKGEISQYANEKSSETMAEAISDYITNGDKAATLSKAIWNKIESAFKTDEWLKHSLLNLKPSDNFLRNLNGKLDPESVLKWIEEREKAQDTDTAEIKRKAQELLADKDLAEKIHSSKDLTEVKKLLEDHIIDADVFLDSENWTTERINEIAKDGFYKNGIEQLGAKIVDGKVEFYDDETRNAVVKFLQNMTNPSAKFAGRGDLVKMFENAEMLSPDKLNGLQKKWQEFGGELGLKVVWLDAHKYLKGAVQDGIIYLNARNNKNISKTFYHEQFHILSALNPELHSDLMNYFKKSFTAKQLDAYRKDNQREDLTDDETIEEILCDNFEQVQGRVKILQDMSKDNTNLLKKFIAYLKNLADKFVSIFRSPEGGMTRTQRDEFVQRFNALAGSLKDIHGNKIFTTYKGGEGLRLANGKNLPKIPLTFSFAGEKALTADKDSLKQAKKLEKQGKNRDEIYQATGWFKGKDNRWRFEIPDNLDKIDFTPLEENSSATLSEIYDNPKLYEAYPHLAKAEVYSEILESDKQGTANGDYNYIVLDENIVKNRRGQAKSVLVHEIQHLIQNYENFAVGGNSKDIDLQMGIYKSKLKGAISEVLNGNGDYYLRARLSLDGLTNESISKDEKKNYLQEKRDFEKDLSVEEKRKLDSIYHWYKNLSKNERDNKNLDDFAKYQRLGGEQESREVASKASTLNYLPNALKTERETLKTLNDKLNSEVRKLSNDERKSLTNFADIDYRIKNGEARTAEGRKLFDKLKNLIGKFPEDLMSLVFDISNSKVAIKDYQDRLSKFEGTPTPHTDDAIIVFGGKEFSMSAKISVDNSSKNADNTISQKVFEKYLGKGIMKMVDETVAKEIGEHIDLSKMSDPVERDSARDRLPYIRRLLTQYNSNTIQRDIDYKNHFAVRIEYARRCFDNDERIKNESVKQMGGNEGQERVRGNRNEIRPDSNTKGNGRIVREVNGGVSRNVSGEVSGARKHFLELLTEEQSHSEKQGGFSNAKSLDEKVSAALADDPTKKILIEQLGGKIVGGKLQADAKTKAKIEKQFSDEGRKNFIAWHGTNRNFNRFSIDKVGTGSSLNRYGYGLYFGTEEVGKSYVESLDELKNDLRTLYKVNIDIKDKNLLDWEKTLQQQPDFVKNALNKLATQKKLSLSEEMTGNEIYRAIFLKYAPDSKYFDDFAYEDYRDKAKKTSELLNSHGIKGIRSYNIVDEGLIYVIFDDKVIKILEKYNDFSINNFVDDSKLTSQQKLIKDFGDRIGNKVIYFSNDNKNFHGAHNNGVTYLNVNSNIPLGKVFWHETLHWLKSNNENLYNQLAKAANLTQEQLQNYLDETGRKDVADNAEVTEEILADSMQKLLDRVQDKNILQKIVAWIQDTLSKFKEMFRNPKGGLTTAQYNRIANAFSKMATSLKDEDGNKIFKFNAKTKQLELTSGEKLQNFANVSSQLETDSASEFESDDISTVAKNLGGKLVGGEWQFADEKSRRAFEKHLANLENNFAGTKFSVDNSDEEGIIKQGARKIFNKVLGVENTNKIITQEAEEKAKRKEQRQALKDFVDNPSAENKQRLKDLNISDQMLEAYKQGKEYDSEIGLFEYWFASPGRIADKNVVFAKLWKMADVAQDVLISLRNKWGRKLKRAFDFVKAKEDFNALSQMLIVGDATATEYGKLTDAELNKVKNANTNPNTLTKEIRNARIKKICEEADVNENVAKAYITVRELLNQALSAIDEARRHPTAHQRHLTDKELAELKNNKFVKPNSIVVGKERDDKGRRLVNYVEYANTAKTFTDVTQSAIDQMKNNPAVQILSVKETGEVGGDKVFKVKVLEGIAPVNKLTGYFPHLFEEWMVRVRDKDGKSIKVIGSAKTQLDAVNFAQNWLKNNQLQGDEEIYVAPKVRSFGKEFEENYAPTMGDKDFDLMLHKIAHNNEIKLKDAKALVDGSVKLKGRHRFFGNLMERKGAQGYSEDVAWVLQHYLNGAARYAALEGLFKPQAISTFERQYGSFNNDYSNNDNAQYAKDFINDVNGVPSRFEKQLNKWLNSWWLVKNFITPIYGERAALTVATKINDLTSKLTLGICNLSSALLNFTQLINAGGYLGGYGDLMKNLADLSKRKFTLNYRELKILAETGVLADIGLDTATGYDKNRSAAGRISSMSAHFDSLLDKGLYFFQAADSMCRIATTLTAYEKAIAEGKTKVEAIEYAKEINRKSNFDYGVNDAPTVFRRSSALGKIILQFYKYPIKMFEVLVDMFKKGINKKLPISQRVAFWIPYFLMTGLAGLIPFSDWLDEWLYKHTDFSPKDASQKTIMASIPKPIAKLLMYGAGAPFNIDTSTRAGMADLMPQDFTSFLMGATGSKIYGFTSNMIRALTIGEEGAYLNALRNVSPGLYNIYVATTGEAFTTRGRKSSVYESLYDRMIRGIGFKSADETIANDIKRITSQDRAVLTKEKQKAVDAYIESPTSENLKRIKELGIKPKTIKEERKKKQLDTLGRVDYGETKKERQQNQYLFDFAN